VCISSFNQVGFSLTWYYSFSPNKRCIVVVRFIHFSVDGQRYSPCVFMYGSSSSEWYISKVWSCIKRSLILDGPIVCCCSSHCQVKI